MPRGGAFSRAVGHLLLSCLLAGGGTVQVFAQEGTGSQLVLVLEPAGSGAQEGPAGRPARAAELLVQLLREDTHLGLVLKGARDLVLPAAPLNQEHRARILKALAGAASGTERPGRPLQEEMQRALGAFPTARPGRRVLFFLDEGEEGGGVPGKNVLPPDHRASPEVLAFLRDQGAVIYAVCSADSAKGKLYQELCQATSGRFWALGKDSSWVGAVLQFFSCLQQPQETEVRDGRLLLDSSVEAAVVVAARAVVGKSVLLISPSGARLTPLTRAPTVRWVAAPDYDLVVISRPRSGYWRLEGARLEDSRVFLRSSLTLTAAPLPREVGADEVLGVSAFLGGPKGETRTLPAGEEVKFGGELALTGQASVRVELRPLPPFSGTPLILKGEFPPLQQPGEGEVRLWAQGRSFQRQVVFPLTVAAPWYLAKSGTAGRPQGASWRWQPVSGRRPLDLEGALWLTSPEGSVAGALVKPAPGTELVLGHLPFPPGTYQVDLELQGRSAEGRHLTIAPPSGRLQIPPRTAGEPAARIPAPDPPGKPSPPGTPSRSFKAGRKTLWLGLSLLGLAILGIAGFLHLRPRLWRKGPTGPDQEGAFEEGNLRLKAQVELLTKEKIKLQEALKEKEECIKALAAEKAELQAELARLQEKSLASAKTLEELEQKLKEAEKEAEAVHSEYMALYARSQGAKETLKKN